MKKMIIGLFVILVLFGCSSKKSELLESLENITEEEVIEWDGYNELSVHSYSNYFSQDYHSENVTVTTRIVENKEDKEDQYFKIDYVKNVNETIGNIVSTNKTLWFNVFYYKDRIEFSISDSFSYEDNKDHFNKHNNGDLNVIKFEGKNIKADDESHQIIVFMNDYIPLMEKELGLNLDEYGYYTEFGTYLEEINDIQQEEEQKRKQEQYEEEQRRKQEEEEKNKEQEKLEQDKIDRENAEKEQIYNEVNNLLDSIIIGLNNNNLNLYSEIYPIYEGIKQNDTYGITKKVSFIVMDVQSFCGDELNREYWKEEIKKAINEWKKTSRQ